MGPEQQRQCIEAKNRMDALMPVVMRARGDIQGLAAQHTIMQQDFLAYSYQPSDNPQEVLMGNGQFVPQVHLDEAKWKQAVQNNPDRTTLMPMPILGLPALEKKLQQQSTVIDQCASINDNLKQGFGNLKDSLQVQSMQRLEECRRRQRQLSRQVLQVMAALEMHAGQTGAARRNDYAANNLGERMQRLEDVVRAPGSAKARLDELWAVLGGLGETPGSNRAGLTQQEAERALSITDSQGELLELLQDEVSRRKVEVEQFESALSQFVATPMQQGL